MEQQRQELLERHFVFQWPTLFLSPEWILTPAMLSSPVEDRRVERFRSILRELVPRSAHTRLNPLLAVSSPGPLAAPNSRSESNRRRRFLSGSIFHRISRSLRRRMPREHIFVGRFSRLISRENPGTRPVFRARYVPKVLLRSPLPALYLSIRGEFHFLMQTEVVLAI